MLKQPHRKFKLSKIYLIDLKIYVIVNISLKQYLIKLVAFATTYSSSDVFLEV